MNPKLITALALGLACFRSAGSQVAITFLDAQKNPIAGVACSQNGGPSGVSDGTGKVTLDGIVALRGPGAGTRRDVSLSRIPLEPGERARVTVSDTKGRKVLDRILSQGDRFVFAQGTQGSRGLYFVDISSPNRTLRGRRLDMGAGVVFEGIRAAGSGSAAFLGKGTAAMADEAVILCSNAGFVTQVYKVADGSSLTVDFTKPKLVPLFDAAATPEPEVHYDRGDAIITQWGDRARDRHAREDQFQSYDHYLTHYWEHRTARYILTDRVAKGGNGIDVSWVTEWKLDNLPEFRAWYSGKGSVAQYYGNYAPRFAKEGPGTYDKDHRKISDQGTQYKYTYTITSAIGLDGSERPLAVGQSMEIEASQFLDAPPVGRDNYYGTVFLYEVGTGGLVPWYTVGDHADQTSERENSHKIDEKAWLGGRTTLPYQYSDEPDNHFMQMATNLSGSNAQPFVLGRRVLHTNFITGAHDEPDNPIWEENIGKVGTNYISTSCNTCHVRNGRGTSPVPGALYNMVVKVGDANGNPHPKLGGVLQPQSTAGAAEGTVKLAGWTESNGLRKPAYGFEGGPVPANYSVRATPQLVGMGLLEAIPETALQALEDPDDADGDGVSGRANIVSDPKTGEPRLGRFGWKAGKASLAHQIAGAFNTDMGVMTSLLPKPDCGSEQSNCGIAGATLADSSLRNLITYISLLGVRARRDYQDPVALQGEALFSGAGCAACHVATLRTGPYHPKAELRNQTIHPYTDLLLHDMGPGLADNLPEGLATGSEWRTPPLWGLGLSACVTGGVVGPFQHQVCSPDGNYLHDGRARTIEEAILWHGGEAAGSLAKYKAMSQGEAAALAKFLNSL
ncbi:MAG: putative exported protein [Fibrobacteres bacterium]|nr:putative exported protein [Fibrobacterota bacterium]